MTTAIEQLPHHIECLDCELRHFLTVNRASDGTWSAGYIAYADDGERVVLPINDAENLDEVALRLSIRLKRWNKHEQT